MKKDAKFIHDNRVLFQKCLQNSYPQDILTHGFPVGAANQVFEKIIEKHSTYYLPYGLCLIHFGLGVPENKEFTKAAFRELLASQEDFVEMPILAYIYAYCENRDGDLFLSEKILNILVKSNFAPAIVTHGDLAWMKNDKMNAKKYYLQSASMEHHIAKKRCLKLFGNYKQKLILGPITFFSYILQILRSETTGERFVYLDFYGFKEMPYNA